HLQPALGDELAAGRKSRLSDLGQPNLGRQVLGRSESEDLPLDRVLQEQGRPVGRRAEDLAQLRAAIAPHHDSLPARMLLAGQTRILAKISHPTIAYDISIHHACEPREA